MEKLSAFIDLFRKGSMVADPKTWKERAALAMAIAGAIMALVQVLKHYGIDLPIDEEKATAIAGGIAVLIGVCSTLFTSDKVGVLPPKLPVDDKPDQVGREDLHGGP